ncbi:MAG: hypothetical protein ABSG41_22080 [Bryobacteraceae bacterium]|jgi:hypothetical protein
MAVGIRLKREKPAALDRNAHMQLPMAASTPDGQVFFTSSANRYGKGFRTL